MNEAQFRDPGEVPVLDWVDKSLIDVDPAYQRRPDEGRVQRILDWFEWSSFGAIVVAPSGDGRFHVTDGQHRLEAARRHPAITVVPAVIIPKSGTTEEAGNFVVLNVERRNISQLDRYALTDALAGNTDEIASEAKAFAKTHRLTVTRAYASVWFRRARKKRKAA